MILSAACCEFLLGFVVLFFFLDFGPRYHLHVRDLNVFLVLGVHCPRFSGILRPRLTLSHQFNDCIWIASLWIFPATPRFCHKNKVDAGLILKLVPVAQHNWRIAFVHQSCSAQLGRWLLHSESIKPTGQHWLAIGLSSCFLSKGSCSSKVKRLKFSRPHN